MDDKLSLWITSLVVVEKEPGHCGMGFVVATGDIITAAHVLPRIPDPDDTGDAPIGVTVRSLDGRLSGKLLVCFADALTDIAVLSASRPYGGNFNEAEAAGSAQIISSCNWLPISSREWQTDDHDVGWIRTVDQKWLRCEIEAFTDSPLIALKTSDVVLSGTSGSPVISESGEVIAIVTRACQKVSDVTVSNSDAAIVSSSLSGWCMSRIRSAERFLCSADPRSAAK